jgi:hypothetical protein
MNEKETQNYEKLVKMFKEDNYASAEGVKRCLVKNLTFRRPHLVNAELINTRDESAEIYVLPMFCKPGKQIYAIKKDTDIYLHSFVAIKRSEEVPVQCKEIKSAVVKRTFEKKSSVFSGWKEDGPTTALDCIEHDLALWHLARFCKSEEEQEKVDQVMKKNAQTLKNIHI